MFKTRIHIYGLPKDISDLREIEVELNDGAGMNEVVSAMREKIPALEGSVILEGENRLAEYYKFNINGHFYFDGMEFELNEGDRIALLMPMPGG
ncbi:MAG: MoaD/ThiS family protein [Spirochaetes bacterium]|nr:MoaD/ThiS family protein [Spirochaetota bacterium]